MKLQRFGLPREIISASEDGWKAFLSGSRHPSEQEVHLRDSENLVDALRVAQFYAESDQTHLISTPLFLARAYSPDWGVRQVLDACQLDPYHGWIGEAALFFMGDIYELGPFISHPQVEAEGWTKAKRMGRDWELNQQEKCAATRPIIKHSPWMDAPREGWSMIKPVAPPDEWATVGALIEWWQSDEWAALCDGPLNGHLELARGGLTRAFLAQSIAGLHGEWPDA